mgnify:CR=1 FL=1
MSSSWGLTEIVLEEQIVLDSISEYQARQITLVIPMTKKESISIWKNKTRRITVLSQKGIDEFKPVTRADFQG